MQKVDVPHHASWVHDMSGGVFLLGDTVDRQTVIASNSNLIYSTKAVGCLELQSLESFIVGHPDTWKSFSPGMERDILKAGLAIEHDLITMATM
jgi:hypothetical protein